MGFNLEIIDTGIIMIRIINTIENAVFNLTEILRTTKVTVDTNKMLQRNFFEDEIKQSKLRRYKLALKLNSRHEFHVQFKESK